ncbi:MAG: DMT family transporter [Polyangia bacterium]
MKQRAAIFAVFATLMFAGMALFAKAAAVEIAPPQLGFVRAAFGLIVVGLYSLRVPLHLVSKRGLFNRAAAGAVAVYLYFTAIAHLPVGVATLLNYTAPVFTALWCAVLYRERIERRTLQALAITTVGIILVLRGRATGSLTGIGVYELVGIGGAVFSGLAMCFITEVRRTDGSWEIFGAFSLGCLLVTTPETVLHWHAPSAHAWLMIICMGMLSVTAQVMMTHSMGYLNATLSGVINQLTPVASLTAGTYVFDERFGTLAWCGIGLTLVGGLFGAWLGATPRRRSA